MCEGSRNPALQVLIVHFNLVNICTQGCNKLRIVSELPLRIVRALGHPFNLDSGIILGIV